MGGGIYASESEVIIMDSEIFSNDVLSESSLTGGYGIEGKGGGIYITSCSRTKIRDSIIHSNRSRYGGGLYLRNDNTVIDNAEIYNNYAKSYGGGIRLYYSSAQIQNSKIHDNYAEKSSGGGIASEYGDYTIQYSDIYNNRAYSGGGIFITGNCSPVLDNVTIRLNSAVNSSGGVAFWENSIAILTNSQIYQNSANYGGGILAYKCNPSEIKYIEVFKNVASKFGGGIGLNGGGTFEFSHATIVGNTAPEGSALGAYASFLYVCKNSIIAYNTGAAVIWSEYPNSHYFRYSDIWGNNDNTLHNCSLGTGAIEGDPLFVDYENNDFNLQKGSPCIDTGDPSTVDPDGTRADMGACPYTESFLTVVTADVSSITSKSSISGGDVTSVGGAFVTEKGLCWNDSGSPTTDDTTVSAGPDAGSFTSELSGLSEDTKYYVRAYARNSKGTSYGEPKSFRTLTTAGCPDCSGENPTVQGATFKAGTDCTCTGDQSLTIGPGVIVESGARATFTSGKIEVKSMVEAKKGAYVKMGR